MAKKDCCEEYVVICNGESYVHTCRADAEECIAELIDDDGYEVEEIDVVEGMTRRFDVDTKTTVTIR